MNAYLCVADNTARAAGYPAGGDRKDSSSESYQSEYDLESHFDVSTKSV